MEEAVIVKRRPLISNHHGDYDRQNQLEAGRDILDAYTDIDIVEIDFILCPNGQLVSMHDFSAQAVLDGATLKRWIELVVVERRLILWIDLKPKWDFVSLVCDTSRHEARTVMLHLVALRRHFLASEHALDILPHVMMASQDLTLTHQLRRYNARLLEEDRWLISEDLPFLGSYVLQRLLPVSWHHLLKTHVQALFAQYDFSHASVVSLDLYFFDDDLEKLGRAVRANRTLDPEQTLLILYNFELSQPLVTLPGYHVVTQYNHRLPPPQSYATYDV
jgi:hypothetical protein